MSAPAVSHPAPSDTSYAFPKANKSVSEWERLDDMHNGINTYLGNRLTFASLDNPQKILELGAGSGAWAIQAARQFPESEVLAVDIAPLPPRPLPSNLKYRQLNLLDPLPFEPESFDVVHARFVLIHLPDVNGILKCVVELVKPGRWLLLDEIDYAINVSPSSAESAVIECLSMHRAYMESNGLSTRVGSSLKPTLRSTDVFSKIDVHSVNVPLNPISNDPALGPLAQTCRLSVERVICGELPGRLEAAGLTPELQQKWRDEVDTTDWSYDFRLFLTSSRKRL